MYEKDLEYPVFKKYSQRIAEYKANLKDKGCAVCGYNKCHRALDFHHVIPDKKNIGIALIHHLGILKQEAAKCVLLCSNCHREVHTGVLDITGLKRATYCDVKQLTLNSSIQFNNCSHYHY